MTAVGMIVGALIWLTFELIGVFRHSDTTTGFVQAWEKKWPVLRIFVAVFCVSLGTHLIWGTWLLP